MLSTNHINTPAHLYLQ